MNLFSEKLVEAERAAAGLLNAASGKEPVVIPSAEGIAWEANSFQISVNWALDKWNLSFNKKHVVSGASLGELIAAGYEEYEGTDSSTRRLRCWMEDEGVEWVVTSPVVDALNSVDTLRAFFAKAKRLLETE